MGAFIGLLARDTFKETRLVLNFPFNKLKIASSDTQTHGSQMARIIH